jgi:hypothetical protein
MAKTQYEVTAVVGRYTDKEGKEKNRYQRIGSIIETKNGPMLKLDLIPVMEDGWSGWAYLNPPRPKEAKYEGLPRDEEFDGDVPF